MASLLPTTSLPVSVAAQSPPKRIESWHWIIIGFFVFLGLLFNIFGVFLYLEYNDTTQGIVSFSVGCAIELIVLIWFLVWVFKGRGTMRQYSAIQ